MKLLLAACFLQAMLLLSFVLDAQPPLHSNPIALSLANCDATLTNHLSGFSSPAGLADVHHSGFVLMGERRFNLNELSMGGAAMVIATSQGTWGVLGSRMGLATWQSTRYGASYSRAFGKQFFAGLQFNYWNEYQAQAGNFGSFSSQAGIIYHPSQDFSVGVHLMNPEQATLDYGDFSMPLPSFLSIGTSWKPVPVATLYLEADKPMTEPLQIALGIEGQVCSLIFLRGGYAYTSQQVSGGVGILFKPLEVHIGFLSNQPLGWISSASVLWKFQ